MHIRYVGFSDATGSRTYNFDVIDTAERREFTVKVQSEAFRPARLKLQDGPAICFARLKQELQGETPEVRAAAHLSIDIREEDIQEYLEQHYPRKPSSSRRTGADSDGVESTSSRANKAALRL
jgi:hypothetical protein